MATPKLLLSKLIRRCRPTPTISSLSSSHSFFTQSHQHLTNPSHKHSLHQPSSLWTEHSLAPYSFSHSRYFSTRDPEYGGLGLGGGDSAATQSELSNLGFEQGVGGGGSGVAEALVSASGEDSIFPVRAVISLLDGYHNLTGWPWWIIIASSTLALRMALLPILILQLNKLKRIGMLFPKLPPPLPPPLSGRSYRDQITLFQKERRAVGCPSYLWFLAYVSIQIPCFLLWMTSIRRMSLDHHPGFDCGGTLWFQNLAEFPHGILGPVFPLLIAGLHFVNVQISFRTSSVGKVTGLFGLLAKQISLNHPDVRKKLGLPDKEAPVTTANPEGMSTPEVTLLNPPTMQRKVSAQNLSPKELVNLSVVLLAKGNKERAITLLRIALDKDPEHVRALVVMGQTLLQKGLLAEATEYLERAISKLFLVGHPIEVEDIDLLILASQWAGVAYVRQGKNAEGIVHLERIAHLKEPEDSKSKIHYYDGLVLLASALYNEGRKVEAAKYLRMAVAYNPAYDVYLEQCENDDDNFVNDLVSSRRADY